MAALDQQPETGDEIVGHPDTRYLVVGVHEPVTLYEAEQRDDGDFNMTRLNRGGDFVQDNGTFAFYAHVGVYLVMPVRGDDWDDVVQEMKSVDGDTRVAIAKDCAISPPEEDVPV